MTLTTLKRIFPLLLTIAALTFTTPVIAQDPSPTPTPQPATGPIYIIQPGDFLSTIASDFGVSLEDLMAVNNITDANSISAGAQIIIPGLEGIHGILDRKPTFYGDTLSGFSRRNQVSEGLLRRLNHITSSSELAAGRNLVYPQKENFTPLVNRINLAPGETLLEASILAQTDPWTLVTLNGLKGNWAALPGDILYTNGMPSAFVSVSVAPQQIKQGGTSTIIVQTTPGVTLGGSLGEKQLHFFALEDGKQVALQGIHAMLEPGLYLLTLEAMLPNGVKQTLEQMVVVQSGFYLDEVLLVEPATIDPVVSDPELQKITDLTAPASPQKYWQGTFKSPSPLYAFPPGCFTSYYGNRRTYIGSGTDETFDSFHSGLDFCGGAGVQISAPADGVVIFAGPLTVRGNATIIDHGWGIYSGIWHQSQIDVQVGQIVKVGDVIGLVGGTGRVTGAHLHWEVWVNEIQVDPMDWLESNYP